VKIEIGKIKAGKIEQRQNWLLMRISAHLAESSG
jgi:hypothetical protein